MKVLIVANFIRNMPWLAPAWTPHLARAIAAKGHAVRVLVDGIESSATLEGLDAEVVRPLRTHLGTHPRALVDRVLSVRRSMPDFATLSLTAQVEGDVWLPLDLAPVEIVRGLFRDLNPLSAMLEFVHHPWLVHKWLANRQASSRAAANGVIDACFGEGSTGCVGLGYASTLGTDVRTTHATAAGALRCWLGISAGDVVFLHSAAESRPRTLAAIVGGYVDAKMPSSRLIVLTRRQHSATKVVETAGGGGVIVLGLSRRVELPLSLADVAVVGPASGGVNTGRFVADAIRVGLPVVASAASSGASLAAQAGAMMVASHDRAAWRAAFEQAVDPLWRRQAAERAISISPSLDVSFFAERLLRELRSRSS